MATTLTDGVTTITPDHVSGYRSARPTNNVVHGIVGSAAPAVTLRPAGLRKGTLEAVFAAMADALALETMLAQDKTFTLAVSTAPARGMVFAATEDLTVELDPDTSARWIVTVGFQEVSA